MRRTVTTGPVVAGLLILTACSAPGEPSPDASIEATEPTAVESTATDDAGEDAGDDAAEESPDDAAVAGAGCLEGAWDMDLATVKERTLSAPGMDQFSPAIEISGASVVTFDGGRMTTEYQDQTSVVTITMDDEELVTTSTFDGAVTGRYTATDTEITVTDVDVSGLDVTNTSVVGGEEIAVPDVDQADDFGVDLGGTSTYTCSADELVMTAQVDDVDTSAFEQRLTRH